MAVRIVTSLLVCLLHTVELSAQPVLPPYVDEAKIPAGAKIELVADRESFYLGENILLHYRITNIGKDRFGLDVGTDYRGCNRAQRFKVKATDASGVTAKDPFPVQYCMGGQWGGTRLKKGDVWYESFLLPRYCQFDRPGVYEIEAYHDLGWGERVPNDPRVQTFRLVLKEPDENAAQAIVATMRQLSLDSGHLWGKRRNPTTDPTLLKHPVYLPYLEQGGDVKCMIAIAHMESVDATAALLRLMRSNNDVVARGAAWAIGHRIPMTRGAYAIRDVSFGYPLFGRLPKVHAWNDDFDVLARQEARTLLDRTNVETIVASSAILMQVGSTNDLPRVIAKLDDIFGRIDPAISKRMPPHGSKRNEYLLLRRSLAQGQEALEQFARRGITYAKPPVTNAEYLTFIAKAFVDKLMDETFVLALKHKNPIIRETAVRKARGHVSGSLAEAVLALLDDSDPYVRFAAVYVINNSLPNSPLHPDKRPIAMSRDLWIRVLGEDLVPIQIGLP